MPSASSSCAPCPSDPTTHSRGVGQVVVFRNDEQLRGSSTLRMNAIVAPFRRLTVGDGVSGPVSVGDGEPGATAAGTARA